ncbi:hypothetical protein ALI144C_38480 [Actinosynnema sp. ALI-1.44]|uniref:DUF4331 domain-containing protein n=1 Tax=Actinosynnema sp. ALI-1.44 TaxID=1933779 RepID=UPI00097C901B|nr:DUF4331 domain-containing protein [Actinosynnema sp. ALI-1.44]ONI74709.1 hypothetical protein ALI144C_38480 [Actinosynnema sp. ALI-1.44]
MPQPHTERVLRRSRAAVALLAVGAALAGGLVPGSATASSHREAPLIAADPTVDNTDLYAFVSPDKPDTVTVVANYFGLQEPNGGPNFYPWAENAHYDINVDNDGDAKADLTFRYTFDTDDRRKNATFLYNNGPVTSINDENLLFRQNYQLELIDQRGGGKVLLRNARSAPSNTGAASMPDFRVLRDQAIAKVPGGGLSYAGPAEDSFFADLRVFDLLYGGNLSEVGQDTLRGFNVNTIALQIPTSMLALKGDAKRNPVIGVWADTERQSIKLSPGQAKPDGPFVQVSRLGNPLVNEVVAPAGLKDAFNGLTPDQDGEVKALLDRVTDPELPKLVEQIYRIPAPAGPRADLVEIFLTGVTTKAGGPIKADLNSQLDNADVMAHMFTPSEMLRLNTSIAPNAKPNRLGVLGGDQQGFPNGRRLTDDVIDIAIQAMEGAAQSGALVQALATGDKVDANDVAFEHKFPYVAVPGNAAVNSAVSTKVETKSSVLGDLPAGALIGGALGALVLLGGTVYLWRKRPSKARHRSTRPW